MVIIILDYCKLKDSYNIYIYIYTYYMCKQSSVYIFIVKVH